MPKPSDEQQQALAQLLGYESPEAALWALTDLSHHLFIGGEEELLQIRQTLTIQQSLFGYETRLRRQDGSFIDVMMNLLLKPDEDGLVEGFVADITERKQAQLRLLQLNEQLEQRVAERNLVLRAHQALEGAEDLLTDLLDISKLDQSAIKPDIDGYRLDEVLLPLVSEFQPVAEAAGLQLVHFIPRYAIQTDFRLLSRILRNFLSNACVTPNVAGYCSARANAAVRCASRSGIAVAASPRTTCSRSSPNSTSSGASAPVMITADRSDQCRKQLQGLGVPVLNKPVKAGKMRSVLSHLLAGDASANPPAA